MKIEQQQSAKTSHRSWMWAGALALVFVVGFVIGKQGGHTPLGEWGSVPARVARSIVASRSGDLPTLAVDMSFACYNDILDQRAQALRAGVYIPSERDSVTATMRLDGSAIPVKMRLLEGPADHLGDGEKWGFEVHTRDDGQLLGMRRFYLSDPADNNWLNQWAFARTLEREGILAARYHIVHLIFNGDDWGMYALQEGFADELLAAQGRPGGVIVKFDAGLLWESIAHFQGDMQAAYADPVANLSAAGFQYLEVDAVREAALARDPRLSAQKDNAIGLLRALQAGELRASEVFDVDKYGRFLALVDLWGATQGTSLVNLRYYYDATSGRLEPIGFNANALGSEDRLPLAATYDDPALQAAYVREAWRVSQPEYLDQLQADLDLAFVHLQRAVSVECAECEAPWDELRHRQEQIRRSLDPVRPVFAYLGAPTLAMSGTLRVDVGNVLNLPVEVVGFDVGGATFLPADRRWLQGGSAGLLAKRAEGVVLLPLDTTRAPVVRYVRFDIPLAEIQRLDDDLDFMEEVEVQVATRVLGLSTTHLTRAREGSPDLVIVGDAVEGPPGY
jgi:hypothetical protein